jgi:DNA-binding transcriptional MerR regulator
MTDDTMTIRQMCDAFDVTPRTLRFYEAKELLHPIRLGTRRLFTRACRGRLTLILRGKHFGFPLEDIRRLLDMYDPATGNAAQIARTLEIARDRLAAMDAERATLDRAIADLTAAIAQTQTLLPKARSAA